MNASDLEAEFQRAVSAQVRLVKENDERFRVLTPFVLEDGDHLCIVLKREDGKWILSDEGHTYMQLTYDLVSGDLFGEGRGEKICEALSFFSLTDHDGELIREVQDQDFGEALYGFVQGLIRIAEVGLLTRQPEQAFLPPTSGLATKAERELPLPQFRTSFRQLIRDSVDRTYTFDWHDEGRDPAGKYTVDCRLEGKALPLFIYLLPGNERVRDATIALHQFHEWQLKFTPVGIFRNAARISRPVRDRFEDVCSTIFPWFQEQRGEIERYLLQATSS